MINIEELRIGNYVYYAGQIGKVCLIDTMSDRESIGLKFSDNNGVMIPVSEAMPVALNGLQLENLGLNKCGDRYYFTCIPYDGIKKDNPNRFLRKETYVPRWGDEAEPGYLVIGSWEGFNDTHLQYLHQLQNIYFALTGQEATYSHE